MLEYKKCLNIMDECIEVFLDKIKNITEISPYRKYCKTNISFAMFNPGNDDYYEYKYFERILEWYIRDLINDILRQIIVDDIIECLWPDEKSRFIIRLNNVAFESFYPFEFIVKRKTETVGYRYTGLASNEIEPLLIEYGVDRVVILNWDRIQDDYSLKQQIGCNDTRVTEQSLKSFFDEYLTSEVYDSFVNKIKDAVDIANEEIGFQTIPNLSLRYLASFKEKLIEKLRLLNYSGMKYKVLDDLDVRTSNRLEKIKLNKSDFDKIQNNFIKDNLYKALIGNEDFAKCFTTSEYLYNIFKEGNSVDYTAVVCGYFKSVEQLLYKVMQIELQNNNLKELWIKCNGYPQGKNKNKNYRINPNSKKKVWQIKFNKENEKYFNIELGSLIWFYNDSDICYISKNERQKIRKLLLQYNRECRNDHFHKNNIYSFQEVERIRNNTILMLFYIIGSCRLYGETSLNKVALGIEDDSFDRLYKKIMEIPKGIDLCFKFKNKARQCFHRLSNQDHTKYSDNGSMKKSTIKFITIEKYQTFREKNFQGYKDTEADVVIDKNNIPEKVWFIKYNGEMVEITW